MRLDNLDRFYKIEEPDREEMIENKKVKNTIRLFKKIVEDFSRHEFTWQDIRDGYNDLYNKKVKKGFNQRYEKSQLDDLVKMGLLIYDKDSKTYSIDHSSPQVARIVEEE